MEFLSEISIFLNHVGAAAEGESAAHYAAQV